MVRTGLGVDVHGLAAGNGLTLGGVTVPFDQGITGHSDGDVVIHAIVDALLGAAALGDLGTHFPSSDEQWRGVSSQIFLKRCRELLAGAGARIQHVDCTVLLQEPPIAEHIPEMRRRVADDLAIDAAQVSIKATTTDHLGLIGRGEGVAALAVATVTTENNTDGKP